MTQARRVRGEPKKDPARLRQLFADFQEWDALMDFEVESAIGHTCKLGYSFELASDGKFFHALFYAGRNKFAAGSRKIGLAVGNAAAVAWKHEIECASTSMRRASDKKGAKRGRVK